jgi:hypothetical protein
MGRHPGGAEWQEMAEQRATRLVAEELRRRGLGRRRVKAAQEGDRAKAQIAQRLRQETTVTWGWIARGLVMGAVGASGYAANACVRSLTFSN